MKTLIIIFALFLGIIKNSIAQQDSYKKDVYPASNFQTQINVKQPCKLETSHLPLQTQETEDFKKIKEQSPYYYVYGYNLDQRRELLQSKHQALYHLPYPEEYIRNTVMPFIRSERVIIAPHFPERSSDIETDRRNMNQWLRDYTEELIHYLIFLDEQYILLKNELK